MERAMTVEAKCGRMRGHRRAGVYEFLGIPFAKPVTGMHRFAAPRPADPFSGTFEAHEYGPAAPQRRMMHEVLAHFLGPTPRFDEDCLTLNVWTPGANEARPVLVFIHGGGFIIGSGAQYPGADLARRGDAVVVTFNYRLGVPGFNGFAELFPDDDRFAANAGLLDQRLALAWVRENIAAFGGDPDRVTICGESAGAASVMFHLAAPRSHPFFSAAILQSGAMNIFHPRQRAEQIAADLFRQLAPDRDRERLFRVDARALDAAKAAVHRNYVGILSRPYVRCSDLPAEELGTLYGMLKPVPIIVGTNRDEYTFFNDLPLIDLRAGRGDFVTWITAAVDAERAARIAALYEEGRAGTIKFGTDILFRMPAIHLMEAHSRRAPTYAYRLDWEARGALANLGATHSVDLPLLFEDFLKPFRSLYLGVMPDSRRHALSERMRSDWMTFVRDGRPGSDWLTYDTTTRATKIFDRRDRIENDPEGERRVAWEGVDGFSP